MITGLVATPDVLTARFRLRAEEVPALQAVRPWLRIHNPWLSAYTASLREVADCWKFVDELAATGGLVASVPGGVHDASGTPLAERLGDEEMAAFLPLDDLKSA